MLLDIWNDFVRLWPTHWMWLFWIMMFFTAVRLVIRWHRISIAHSKSLPQEILRLRFACGEIDRAEFKRRLNQLFRLTKTGRR